MKVGQTLALINGSDFVTAQMVQQVAKPVLAHRVLLRSDNAPDEKGHRFSNKIVARMRADHPDKAVVFYLSAVEQLLRLA
jgi:MoxR-like ATPase